MAAQRIAHAMAHPEAHSGVIPFAAMCAFRPATRDPDSSDDHLRAKPAAVIVARTDGATGGVHHQRLEDAQHGQALSLAVPAEPVLSEACPERSRRVEGSYTEQSGAVRSAIRIPLDRRRSRAFLRLNVTGLRILPLPVKGGVIVHGG